MQKGKKSALFLVGMLLVLATPFTVLAQTAQPTQTPGPTQPPLPVLTFFTPYPSQVFGIGETISVDLNLQVSGVSQSIALSMKDVPAGWNASFRGNGRVIQSVYLEADKQNTVQLRLDPPQDVKAGSYQFTASAAGSNLTTTLPLVIIIQEKVPPKLSLGVDLPTLKGAPTTTFTYNVTLKNDGADDLVVALSTDSKNVFQVAYKMAGQEVTSLPVVAGDSKSLSVEATALNTLQAGDYPITLLAKSGTVQASLDLTASVTGQVDISITTPDGRLSGDINSGSSTPLKLDVKNNGTATATRIALSATSPTGWTVTFDPAEIASLGSNQQVEVTLNVQPSDQSVAGDYMLSLTAQPNESTTKSVDFRVTELTSTLWGIVGVILIAVAVLVVALAVMRFGRR